ncbi:hypothetical protein [Streptomyces litchfieldiae]|uniref:Uncharacterized protein n=1 Tax=Streptomyces litchfieldiae TaxID=3075543 RepID=A0ABU2N383_9ACTN|nr:hypothetical protein [Streptomyces sp. DSM 44938]MDT0347184.1 hypothetical protein [Streptomyces sp. DSM 44938]
MEYYQLLAGLALGQLREDNGSGPPPAVPGHEADRRAARAAARTAGPEPAPRVRRLRAPGRRRGTAPATVT